MTHTLRAQEAGLQCGAWPAAHQQEAPSLRRRPNALGPGTGRSAASPHRKELILLQPESCPLLTARLHTALHTTAGRASCRTFPPYPSPAGRRPVAPIGHVPATCSPHLTLPLLAAPCAVPQRDFSVSTCATCGMLYGRGLPEEERLHAAFHNAHAAAFRFPVSEDPRIADGGPGPRPRFATWPHSQAYCCTGEGELHGPAAAVAAAVPAASPKQLAHCIGCCR